VVSRPVGDTYGSGDITAGTGTVTYGCRAGGTVRHVSTPFGWPRDGGIGVTDGYLWKAGGASEATFDGESAAAGREAGFFAS